MTTQTLLQVAFVLGVLILLGLVPGLFVALMRSTEQVDTRDWAGLSGLLLLAGLLTRIGIISLVAGLALIAIGVAWLWHKVVLADVHYERFFKEHHLFPDEETQVTWTLRNDKPIPISWLRWQEGMPLHPFGSRSESDDAIDLENIEIRPILDGRQGIDEVTSIAGFETLVKTSRVRALRRGYYRFGPTKWEASDVLGLFTATMSFEAQSALTVFPRLYRMEELQVPTEALLGDLRRQSLIEDPTWYRGAREYGPHDPMRVIDWKATARTRDLYVKTFEPTVHPKLMILANLHAFERISEGLVTDYMEDVISTAASVARWGLDAGFEVGIISNGILSHGQGEVKIMPSAGDNQLFDILDYLAKVMLIVDQRVEDVLRGDLADLPHGTTLVVCSNVVTQGTMAALADAARRRHIALLLVNNDTRLSIPRVSVTHITPSYQVA